MMTACMIDGLKALLSDLGVDVPIPAFSQSDILRRPIDIYRNYLADTASKVLGCDSALAYEAIQSANIKDNSDLTLVLPKLKWRTDKPKDLARDAFIKVTHILKCLSGRRSVVHDCSSPRPPYFSYPYRMACISASSSPR